MGFINVFIKSGLLGLLGFLICYISILKQTFSLKNKDIKINILIIFSVLLISSLVESYICSIRGIFGIFCYFVISGLITIGKEQEKQELAIHMEEK